MRLLTLFIASVLAMASSVAAAPNADISEVRNLGWIGDREAGVSFARFSCVFELVINVELQVACVSLC